MEALVGNLVHSVMIGMSCSFFFGTLLSGKRSAKRTFNLSFLAFTAGFVIIAFSEAPGYLLQPLRVIIILYAIIRIFYRVEIGKAILLSGFWCAIFWALNLAAVSVVYGLPEQYVRIPGMSDWICVLLLLCISFLFHHRCSGWLDRWEGTGWRRFVWLPVLSLVVTTLMCLTVWYTDSLNKPGVVVTAVGYSAINILIFFFIGSILQKETEVRDAQIMQARLENQMELVENIKENDIRYRRYLHDYKNQLGCIQGMLKDGRTEEALSYIEELNGSIRRGEDHVNTKHPVVNTVLNQKYLRAQEKGITLVMAVNDLSGLAMGSEDIVILLVNLLDNAIEACEKLKENKLIQFKLMLEEDELTISVRNPVHEPIAVKGKRIRTTKKEFYFSAMIPV